MSDMDTLLDAYAQVIAERLNHLDLEGAAGKSQAPALSKTPICRTSGLDWMCHSNGDPITRRSMTSVEFTEQIRLCGLCGYRKKCLELATSTNAEYGIWGGTMPRERNQ